MDLTRIKDILYITLAVSSVLGSFIGGIWWLSSVWTAIKENRKLREEDQAKVMSEIENIHLQITKVETETRHRVEQTHKLFSEIQSQIARLEGKIEVFFNKK